MENSYINLDNMFVRYNVVIGITFVISYGIMILMIDMLKNPAWLIIPIITVVQHIARYYLIFWRRKL